MSIKELRLAAPLLLAGLIACALLAWPGGIYTDTVGLIQQGQTGHFDDWHSPTLALILHVLGFVRPGTAPIFILGAVLLQLGLYLIFRRLGVSIISSACMSVLVLLSPTIYTANFWLSKDTPALGALLLGCALVISPSIRVAGLGGLALMLAFLIRLDYGVLGCCAIAYAWIVRRPSRALWRNLWRFTYISLLCFVAGNVLQTGIHAALRVKSQAPVQASLLHDLGAISVATGDHRAPAFMLEQGWDKEFVASHFDPYSHDPLKWPSGREGFAYTRNGADHLDTLTTWIGAVIDYPTVYLSHRATITGALLGVVAEPKVPISDVEWLEEHTAAYCQQLRSYLQLDDCEFVGNSYNESVIRTYRHLADHYPVVFHPITYLALVLVGFIGILVPSRSFAQRDMLVMITALPLLQILLLFLVVPSAEYRYLSLTYVAGQIVMLSSLYSAAKQFVESRGRRSVAVSER